MASRSDPPDFEQFAAVRRYAGNPVLSPDGTEVVYATDTSGQFNLWRQASTGGYPHQLTLFAERTAREAAWSPDGQTLLFAADRNGDEFHQLFLIPARGGRPHQLTDLPDVQHFLAEAPFSPDGATVAYCANDRDRTAQDVLVRDLRSGEVRRLLADGGWNWAGSWSPDGRFLTVTTLHSSVDTDVLLIEIATGAVRRVTEHEGDVFYWPGPWAADNSGFWLRTDAGREVAGLAFYDLARGAYRWVETPDWEIDAVAASADGRYLAWTVNEEGSSRLHVRDLAAGRPVDLSFLPAAMSDGFCTIEGLVCAPSGGKIGFFVNRPVHPPELVVIDLDNATAAQITHGFLGGLDERDLIEPELIRYPTFDDRRIPAFLYRPRGDGPFPVVLSIHGGPEAQERPAYADRGFYQYLLSRGIGVLAPNVRGSTGYGKSYQKLIHRDWGGGDLGDFAAARDYLRALPWVDPAKIGLYGGSYGGFAVLSCVSRLPEGWAAAVDIVGPSNLVTMVEGAPPTWRDGDLVLVGDPVTDADFLHSRSPLTFADRITTPLFVIQGANDPRTPRSESDQIVAALRAHGVVVRYDLYDDEGHGFTKNENDLKSLKDAAAFLEEHLNGPGRVVGAHGDAPWFDGRDA